MEEEAVPGTQSHRIVTPFPSTVVPTLHSALASCPISPLTRSALLSPLCQNLVYNFLYRPDLGRVSPFRLVGVTTLHSALNPAGKKSFIKVSRNPHPHRSPVHSRRNPAPPSDMYALFPFNKSVSCLTRPSKPLGLSVEW